MAIQEIRVGLKEGIDPRAETLKKRLIEWGIDGIGDVRATTVYRFEEITPLQAEKLAREVLADPITQEYAVNAHLVGSEATPLEIGYKPGVMNPVEASLKKAAIALGIEPAVASSSTVYYFYGEPTPEQLTVIGSGLASQVEEMVREKPETLIISGKGNLVEMISINGLDEKGLGALSNARSLFLDIQEMQVIQDYFASLDRNPTDVELETLAQTWSEHSGHKTFKAKLITVEGNEKEPLIQRIRETSEKYFGKVGVVTAFADNAGGIRFCEGYAIIGKGETHNSPVAIEPFGGAATKNGGLYRDIAGTGLGGHNLFGLMVDCLGLPDMKAEDVSPGTLHPKHLLLENSRGERDYGNKMGVPTHGVSLHFHPDYGPKPTSMGIAIGIIPENKAYKGEPQPGDFIVTVGGGTGRDGIHGATFSSGAMTADTQTIHSTAVQLGNAIEQKRMLDALIAARDADLIQAVTDCGGGGYSSAIGEMAQNIGAEVNLERVPLKYQGLNPWEIWLSESQERMVVAVNPHQWGLFKRICDRFDTPAEVIGTFTGNRTLTLKYDQEIVGQLAMEFLHNGLPERVLQLEYTKSEEKNDLPALPIDWLSVIKQVLGHFNVCSKEVMHRQYDQTVQGTTALAPFTGVEQDVPNDAIVVAPLCGRPYGVVAAQALNPILNRIDPYAGSIWTIACAVAKYTAVGGDLKRAALIDNFVWPKPTPKFLGDLDRSVDALCMMMDLLEIPCVSGKDSLSGTYISPDGKEINIPPVLNVTVFGWIPDVEKTVSADIKSTDSVLVLVGKPDVNNLGGSIYFQTQGVESTHLPNIDLDRLADVLDTVHQAIQSGKVKSCRTIGEGGLITTLTQMCFGGDCGADIDISPIGATRADFALFSETAGCFVIELSSEDEAKELFRSVPHIILGRTMAAKNLAIKEKRQPLFNADLYQLKETWQRSWQ